MDLVDMGGHDNQAWYNYALLEGVNEQLAAAKRKVRHFDTDRRCLCCSVYVLSVYACVCVSACFPIQTAVLGRWPLGVVCQCCELPSIGAHISLTWHGQAWCDMGMLSLKVNIRRGTYKFDAFPRPT